MASAAASAGSAAVKEEVKEEVTVKEEPTEEATQPAEATPAEEVLQQSSAIVSADPELNRVVAAMQPAAGHPTATDTWLLQLVPQTREVAVSVRQAVQCSGIQTAFARCRDRGAPHHPPLGSGS